MITPKREATRHFAFNYPNFNFKSPGKRIGNSSPKLIDKNGSSPSTGSIKTTKLIEELIMQSSPPSQKIAHDCPKFTDNLDPFSQMNDNIETSKVLIRNIDKGAIRANSTNKNILQNFENRKRSIVKNSNAIMATADNSIQRSPKNIQEKYQITPSESQDKNKEFFFMKRLNENGICGGFEKEKEKEKKEPMYANYFGNIKNPEPDKNMVESSQKSRSLQPQQAQSTQICYTKNYQGILPQKYKDQRKDSIGSVKTVEAFVKSFEEQAKINFEGEKEKQQNQQLVIQKQIQQQKQLQQSHNQNQKNSYRQTRSDLCSFQPTTEIIEDQEEEDQYSQRTGKTFDTECHTKSQNTEIGKKEKNQQYLLESNPESLSGMKSKRKITASELGFISPGFDNKTMSVFDSTLLENSHLFRRNIIGSTNPKISIIEESESEDQKFLSSRDVKLSIIEKQAESIQTKTDQNDNFLQVPSHQQSVQSQNQEISKFAYKRNHHRESHEVRLGSVQLDVKDIEKFSNTNKENLNNGNYVNTKLATIGICGSNVNLGRDRMKFSEKRPSKEINIIIDNEENEDADLYFANGTSPIICVDPSINPGSFSKRDTTDLITSARLSQHANKGQTQNGISREAQSSYERRLRQSRGQQNSRNHFFSPTTPINPDKIARDNNENNHEINSSNRDVAYAGKLGSGGNYNNDRRNKQIRNNSDKNYFFSTTTNASLGRENSCGGEGSVDCQNENILKNRWSIYYKNKNINTNILNKNKKKISNIVSHLNQNQTMVKPRKNPPNTSKPPISNSNYTKNQDFIGNVDSERHGYTNTSKSYYKSNQKNAESYRRTYSINKTASFANPPSSTYNRRSGSNSQIKKQVLSTKNSSQDQNGIDINANSGSGNPQNPNCILFMGGDDVKRTRNNSVQVECQTNLTNCQNLNENLVQNTDQEIFDQRQTSMPRAQKHKSSNSGPIGCNTNLNSIIKKYSENGVGVTGLESNEETSNLNKTTTNLRDFQYSISNSYFAHNNSITNHNTNEPFLKTYGLNNYSIYKRENEEEDLKNRIHCNNNSNNNIQQNQIWLNDRQSELFQKSATIQNFEELEDNQIFNESNQQFHNRNSTANVDHSQISSIVELIQQAQASTNREVYTNKKIPTGILRDKDSNRESYSCRNVNNETGILNNCDYFEPKRKLIGDVVYEAEEGNDEFLFINSIQDSTQLNTSKIQSYDYRQSTRRQNHDLNAIQGEQIFMTYPDENEDGSQNYFQNQMDNSVETHYSNQQRKHYSIVTRNKTYDASSAANRKNKRFADRNIPTLKDEIIRYQENDKQKQQLKNAQSGTNLKNFLGTNMKIAEKKILEYIMEQEHFDPKKRETLRNFFCNQKFRKLNSLSTTGADTTFRMVSHQPKDSMGGYLMGNQGRTGKGCERVRNGSLCSDNRFGGTTSVYSKLALDKSLSTVRKNSATTKNYKSSTNILNGLNS